MRRFLTALQFLTRIQIKKQDNLTAEDFGKSVPFFPLVGLVLGFCSLVLGGLLFQFTGMSCFTVALLTVLPVLLTGGIHADGLMDTADGLFSGRERARMLEIMKDSRTGSFGVVAFGVWLLVFWSLALDLSGRPMALLAALFVLPVIGRAAMALVIGVFPYARKEGMGRAFHDLTGKRAIAAALLVALAAMLPWGPAALLALVLSLGFALLWGRYASGKLGGLTGDVYGATCALTELFALLVFWGIAHIPLGLLLFGWQGIK